MDAIWKQDVKMPEFPQAYGSIKTDVLIIGGGLAGLLCAYRLEQAGVDYTLIEADRICGGVSGYTTAKITSQHGLIYDKLLRKFGAEKALMYLRANEAAVGEYRQLCRQIDCDFEEKSSFVYSADLQKLEEEMLALDELGHSAKFVKPLSLPVSAVGAVGFSGQAQFHPLKFAANIAQGLNIHENTKALAYEGNGIVTTPKGEIHAQKIIVATHFPFITKHGSYFLKLYQHRSYVLALKNVPDVKGMYVDENQKGLSFRNYGDLLLLGGGSHRTGKQGGGWEELSAFANAHYPQAQDVCRWATQDCMTLDDVPYIGRYSRRTENMYVATGFGKWGITSSMVSSMILSDLVQGKENEWAAVFSPSRTMRRKQLLVNGFEAVSNLLRPTKPRCPHMGCALKWNAQERSWDCSCHGSRFTEQGNLINNPATDDLKRK